MSNIFHQSVEAILRAATPEQKIIWNDVFLRYGERCSISQFSFRGLNAGSELNTYVARKMYFALQLDIGGQNGVVALPYALLYNENNVQSGYLSNGRPYWDVTAATPRYLAGSICINNQLFSRIDFAGSSFLYIQFIGYRITY